MNASVVYANYLFDMALRVGKRKIEGALNVTPLPNRPRGPNEDATILIPGDEAEGNAEPVNVVCPWKVVPFINCIINGAQMELPELEQLPGKMVHEQADRAFRLQAAVSVVCCNFQVFIRSILAECLFSMLI